MPAAAVASRTPSMGGISGKDAGASGEMLVDTGDTLMRHGRACSGHPRFC
jgi:hypothetical protein